MIWYDIIYTILEDRDKSNRIQYYILIYIIHYKDSHYGLCALNLKQMARWLKTCEPLCPMILGSFSTWSSYITFAHRLQ